MQYVSSGILLYVHHLRLQSYNRKVALTPLYDSFAYMHGMVEIFRTKTGNSSIFNKGNSSKKTTPILMIKSRTIS